MAKRRDRTVDGSAAATSVLDLFAQDDDHDGQARHFLLGVLEVFFRRPLALILPALVFAGLGVALSVKAENAYESSGVITSTQQGILESLNEINNNPVSYETSATVTARSINDLLDTDFFIDQVITNAGLTTAVSTKELTRDGIRASIKVEDAGDDLVRVTVTSPRAEQSYRTATAVLRSFVEWRISQSRQDTNIAIEELRARYDESLAELNVIKAAQAEYLAANPIVAGVDPPIGVTLQLNQYEAELDTQRDIVRGDRDTLNQALSADSSAAQIETARYRTVDAPTMPDEPLPRLKTSVILTFAATCLGALIGLALLVVLSLFDRTVRTPNDIARRFDLDVVAVLPRGLA